MQLLDANTRQQLLAADSAMLTNFFRLDTPFEEFDEEKLIRHFRVASDLKSTLYQPDRWPNDTRKLKSVTFTNVSLSKTVFENVTFTACEFVDCLFIGSLFTNVEFHRCKFTDCNFYKTEFDRCYIDPRTISFDKRYRRETANIGVQLYHQLLENSSRSRQSKFEMNADIEFRRWRRWPQASPHFFRRDVNKLEIGQSVGRSIVVAPRGWPSFSFPRFRAGGNERRVNIRLLQMLMVHVGVKNEGIREGVGNSDTIINPGR
jgi:Pentapeptide repeats (9 copies)